MISYRYSDKDTPIHGLNPLCKLVWIAAVVILSLVFDNPLYILLLFLSTLPMIIIARVGKEWRTIMRFTAYLCVVIIIINALLSPHGSYVLYQAPFRIPVMGVPRITLEAILCGVGNSIRLLAIISAFAVLNLTVHPDDIMLAMLSIKLPYKSVLVTSLATRFIPTLIDDVKNISDAQRSRGFELDKGKLLHRIKGSATIIIPLLCNSLDRTVQIAEAMESRAFGAIKSRTFYRQIRLSQVDTITLALGITGCAFGISMRWMGWGSYQYYPTMSSVVSGVSECLLLLGLTLLLAATPAMAFLKRRIDLD